MIKLFFATFFIAELIIALAVILKIYQLDKCVNSLNNLVVNKKYKIKMLISDIHVFLEEFVIHIDTAKKFIKAKREEYILKTLKTSLMYTSIFLLRGKYKKAIFAYQVVKEIYDGLQEA